MSRNPLGYTTSTCAGPDCWTPWLCPRIEAGYLGSGGLHGTDAKHILQALPKDGQRLGNLALAHGQRRQEPH